MSGSGSGQYPQIPSLTSLPYNPMASQQAQAPAYNVVNQFMQNWMKGGYPGYLPSSGIIPGIAPMPSVAPVSVGNSIYQASLNPKPPVVPVVPTPAGYTGGRGTLPAENILSPGARGSYVEGPVPYVQMPAPVTGPIPYIEMPSAVQIPGFTTRTY